MMVEPKPRNVFRRAAAASSCIYALARSGFLTVSLALSGQKVPVFLDA